MILLKERIGRLLRYAEELIWADRRPVEEYRILETEQSFLFPDELPEDGWRCFRSDQQWGGQRRRYYFQTTFIVPEHWEGRTLVYELKTGREAEWDALNPQFTAYVNGELRQGMDVNHREVLLTSAAQAGEEIQITLSAYTGEQDYRLVLDSEVRVLIPEIEKYYYDVRVPYETARWLEPDSVEYIDIIRALNESLNLLDLRAPYSEAFYESLDRAQAYLDEEFYDKLCEETRQKICCVGHSHIDVAWLWTLRTTRDKAVRSFATVLELMRQYPEYKYMSSQPQLYQYVKEDAPEVHEEIKARIAEGRWEAEGGMWLEADCNIASGEALVRQFTHGMRFFKEEFGVENKVLWLPDVFGYSAALPQIMKKCGIDYFMTTKISWSEFNKMPYDTFMWKGIDGTEVLTHFIPTRDFGAKAKEGTSETEHFTTYNGMLNPRQVKGNWHRYGQKDISSRTLFAYGYGDGGGGPTKEMLENQRRIARGIPGCPSTKQTHVREFFEELEAEVAGNKYLPQWVGELYLEFHRGTYTSMARNKKYNRTSEFAYQNLELYASMAKRLLGLEYPKDTINASWQVLLRNQFHDILPGSSIKEVYEDSKEEYEQILKVSETLTTQILDELTAQIRAQKGDVVIFNPNSVSVTAPVLIPTERSDEALVLTDGNCEYPLQKTEAGMLAVVDGVNAKGYRTFGISEKTAEESWITISETGAETPFFRVVIDEKGQFTSIYDKAADRELLPAGESANVIIAFEDRPHDLDAWDINHYYKEKSWPVDQVSSISIIEQGPVRACLKIERPYQNSVICQYLYFYKDLYRIDIRNEIDWNESLQLLRAYFPLDILADEATFEIQYGNVKRATHNNTSWDFAKFEVCMHKWLDVSEHGYGVSILNDCKFGADVTGSRVGLTMLKSALYPNPDADKEHHTFWYSICPHEGDFREGEIIDKAYVFNNPYKAVMKKEDGAQLEPALSFVTSDAPHVVVEVVKEADAGEDTIVRLYECYKQRGPVTLTFACDVRAAYICNLLEENEQEVETDGKRVRLDVDPFEIVTLRIIF